MRFGTVIYWHNQSKHCYYAQFVKASRTFDNAPKIDSDDFEQIDIDSGKALKCPRSELFMHVLSGNCLRSH